MGLTIPGAVPPTWKGGSIQRVDLATGAVTTLYTESTSGPLRAPNDLVFDAHGGFWFTDHGVRLDRSQRPHRASTTPRPTARAARRSSSRSTRPTASGCRPTAPASTPPRPTPAACSGGSLVRARRGRAATTRRPRRPPARRAARPPAPRQPGRRRRGVGVRRHARQRWHHRHQPRRRDGRAHAAARPARHQHLLRRPDLRTAYCTLSGTGALVAFDWPRRAPPPPRPIAPARRAATRRRGRGRHKNGGRPLRRHKPRPRRWPGSMAPMALDRVDGGAERRAPVLRPGRGRTGSRRASCRASRRAVAPARRTSPAPGRRSWARRSSTVSDWHRK